MTLPHPSRPVRLAAVVAVAGLALGGCSMFSPQTTTNVTYAPSDGLQGEVGEVAVRNVFLLTEEQGAPATLVGALFNPTDEDVELVVDVQGGLASETIDVPAGAEVFLGPEAEEQVLVEGLEVIPGLTAEVTLIGSGGSLNLLVPVLDGSLPEYADLVPETG